MATRATEPPALHLTFIDGMRGFAAVYVVLHHEFNAAWYGISSSSIPPLLYHSFSHGHAMVTIFIAISGFCLMLPVSRNGLTLRGGAGVFFKKRARRILPPYYVVLGLSILAIVLSQPRGVRIAYLRDPFTFLSIWTHLLLIHNWFLKVVFNLNGPLWSVATECQIYLIFPLMVMAWKRFTAWPTLLAVFLLSGVGFHMVGQQIAINYLFIFALGMAGADLAVRGNSPRLIQWICWVSLAGYFVDFRGNEFLSDIFIGTFSAALMAALSKGEMPWARKVLSLPVLAWFGSFSYSLYLTHGLVMDAYLRSGLAANLSSDPMKRMLELLFGLTPIIVLFAYLFYWVAERPFVNLKRVLPVATVLGVGQQERRATAEVS
jgi:peptidoglycan/LPS O-acetylase OafA/YrhL